MLGTISQCLDPSCPRDTQRDASKQAEKEGVVFGALQVIVCHTESMLRRWLPDLRGESPHDTRSAEVPRAGNTMIGEHYEYGQSFLGVYSNRSFADLLGACVVWSTGSSRPHLASPGLAFAHLSACSLHPQTLRYLRSD